ncbi:hypothetical protein [Pseudomonas entomophila]|uniref:hypothetical protein n=1 Tax=Pseudomonas entomophila TaxID=312306 RepID=UPI00200E68CF|nr:hypothetical protein [Pseudomonas entomophila]
MDIKTFTVCAMSCLGSVAQVHATSDISSGVLQFTGSIVEPSCRGGAGDWGVRLDECPSGTLGSHIDVQSVESQGETVQIISNGTLGRTSHSYRLVDASGKQLSKGSYVVILTSP